MSDNVPNPRPVQLDAVQETLLIPLYGRAVDHARPAPVLGDARAAELVASLDYDFARFDGLPSLLGAVLRTALFDHWTREFLRAHPAGTVVELGAGLNTRYERVDNGRATWFELDLPEVVELRDALFAGGPAPGTAPGAPPETAPKTAPETAPGAGGAPRPADGARRTALAASVTDPAWIDVVTARSAGPHLLAAEAVLPFLTEEEVRRTLTTLAGRFPGALLALDSAGPGIVHAQEEHDALSRVEARMRWSCPDPAAVTTWLPGARRLGTHTLTTLPPDLVAGLPEWCRATLTDLAAQRLPQVEEYRLSLFRLPGAEAGGAPAG